MAKTIFALGMIGTGLLAIPVMAGASGYALSDALGWRQGLSNRFTQAKKFYALIGHIYDYRIMDKFYKYRSY